MRFDVKTISCLFDLLFICIAISYVKRSGVGQPTVLVIFKAWLLFVNKKFSFEEFIEQSFFIFLITCGGTGLETRSTLGHRRRPPRGHEAQPRPLASSSSLGSCRGLSCPRPVWTRGERALRLSRVPCIDSFPNFFLILKGYTTIHTYIYDPRVVLVLATYQQSWAILVVLKFFNNKNYC